MMIKVFTTDKNGKVVLSPKELKELLDEAYWEGYRANNKTWTYTTPTWTPYYYTTTAGQTTISSGNATISAGSSGNATINAEGITNGKCDGFTYTTDKTNTVLL